MWDSYGSQVLLPPVLIHASSLEKAEAVWPASIRHLLDMSKEYPFKSGRSRPIMNYIDEKLATSSLDDVTIEHVPAFFSFSIF